MTWQEELRREVTKLKIQQGNLHAQAIYEMYRLMLKKPDFTCMENSDRIKMFIEEWNNYRQ